MTVIGGQPAFGRDKLSKATTRSNEAAIDRESGINSRELTDIESRHTA
jgi:hypothetical protein